MALNLNDMAVFAEVVEANSFTEAAARLGLPKSNISRRVSRLEDALSVRLLERTTRKLRVTEIGEVYFRHCRRMLDEADHAQQCVDNLSAAPRGLLRVSASVTTGQQLLAPLMAGFLHEYSEISLDLDLTNRRVDPIEEGFDLVIRVGQLEDSGLIARRLGELTLQLCASPAYVAANGTPASPDDLSAHMCLTIPDMGSPTSWTLSGNWGTRTVQIIPRATIRDFATVREMVLAGGGITALPDYMCRDFEREGRLVRILPDWALPTVEFHAIYPSYRGVTPKLRAFLDYLTEKIGDRLGDQ